MTTNNLKRDELRDIVIDALYTTPYFDASTPEEYEEVSGLAGHILELLQVSRLSEYEPGPELDEILSMELKPEGKVNGELMVVPKRYLRFRVALENYIAALCAHNTEVAEVRGRIKALRSVSIRLMSVGENELERLCKEELKDLERRLAELEGKERG